MAKLGNQYKNVYAHIHVEVDLTEFVDDLSDDDRRLLADALLDDADQEEMVTKIDDDLLVRELTERGYQVIDEEGNSL